jgi:dipeptidyl aminopeptidase/acylaminoacyl peptidase
MHSVRMLVDLQLSPDGRMVAFTVVNQDADANQQKSAIWIAATDGSTPPRRLTGGKRRDQRPRFSPDGRRLAFLSNRDKEWRPDLYALDLVGGEPACVARLPRGVLDFDWAADGRRFALLGRPDWPEDPDRKPPKNDEVARVRYLERARHLERRFRYRLDGTGQLDDEEPQVWVVDSAGLNQGLKQLTSGDWSTARARWMPDGRIAFLSNREEDWWRSEVVDVWAISPDGGEPERLTDGTGPITTFAFAPDGRLAVVRVGEGVGSLYARHHRLLVDGEDRTAGIDRSVWAGVLADMMPAREGPVVEWTPDGEHVYFPLTDGGRIHVHRVGAGSGAPEQVLGGDRVMPAFSLGGGRLAFLSTAFDEPLTLRVANADGTDEKVLYDPNPWMHERALGEVRVMNFEHEGRTIDAWALLPPGYAGGRVPTILNIHGGPHAAWGWSFPYVMQTLAGQGYAVVFCNSPGSQTYEQEYAASLTGRWGELDFPVWMKLVDKAVADGFADSERLGVSGASYGGFSTLWVIGHTDRFRAAISMRPVADLQAFYGSSDIGWNFGEHSFGAEPWQDPELFRRLSPITYVDNMTTPVRIIASTGDLRTPLEQAEQVYIRLLKLGREVDLLIFSGEPHAIVVAGKPWNRVRHMRAVTEWWARHLQAPVAAEAAGAGPAAAT